MKVRVYSEIDPGKGGVYPVAPSEAARSLAREQLDPSQSHTVVVEPLDDEARALPGWQSDEDGPFRLYVLTPTTIWAAEFVETFAR